LRIAVIEGSSGAAAPDGFDLCESFDVEHNRFADYGHDTNSGSSLSSAADLATDVQTEELLSVSTNFSRTPLASAP